MALDLMLLSKTISHALRHEPWLYELELDREGWVDASVLLAALRESRPEWRHLELGDLEQLIRVATKRRLELRAGRIRALYGHSAALTLEKVPATPPGTLYHGTSPEAAARVLVDGLKPMGRLFVHLSTDVATAMLVGRRKASRPVLLVVRAAEAASAGVRFFVGNEQVWLAQAIPARFIGVSDEVASVRDGGTR